MPSTYNNRILYSNPSAGQCNWDVEVERNNRINASIIPPGLDGNYVASGGLTSVGTGLSVDITEAVVMVGGVLNKVIATNLILQPPVADPFEVNFVWVDVNGTVQVTQEEPNETMVMLSIIDTDATSVLRIIDGRQMLSSSSASAARKNKIVNGNMRVDQRNNHAWALRVSPFFSADNWQFVSPDGAFYSQCYNGTERRFSYVQVETPPAPLVDVGYVIPYWYMFEGQDVGSLNEKAHYLSFEIEVSVAGQYSVALRSNPVTWSIVFLFNVDTPGVPTTYSFLVPPQDGAVSTSDNNVGLDLVIGATQGPSGTSPSNPGSWENANNYSDSGNVQWHQTVGAHIRLGSVQLEEGVEPTDLEYRTYGQELALCKRYYSEDFFYTTASGLGTTGLRGGGCQFSTTMRISPVVTSNSFEYYNGSWNALTTVDIEEHENGIILNANNITGVTAYNSYPIRGTFYSYAGLQ